MVKKSKAKKSKPQKEFSPPEMVDVICALCEQVVGTTFSLMGRPRTGVICRGCMESGAQRMMDELIKRNEK
ncbi:MAG TPA: hypothetical protein P5523_04900 [Bacteroidales bacterium]|nr:hypothetical protein [Bacteroidales bacterium]